MYTHTHTHTHTYIYIYILNFILTPWSRVVLEKLIGLQLVKKFRAFYGTRRFITTFISARHLSLSWASSIHFIPPHTTSWRSILILTSHLRLGLPSGLLPSGFVPQTCTRPSPIRSTFPAHLINVCVCVCVCLCVCIHTYIHTYKSYIELYIVTF